jgi:hypothetical protein
MWDVEGEVVACILVGVVVVVVVGVAVGLDT